MSKYKVDYYDSKQNCNCTTYVMADNWREAVVVFRQYYTKEDNVIVELSKVIEKDWRKY